MAWAYYKGVQQAGYRALINGPSTGTETNVHALAGDENPGGLAPTGKGAGCVRAIYEFNTSGALDAKAGMVLGAGIPMFLPTLEFNPNSAALGTGITTPGSATGAIKQYHDFGKVCHDNGIKYIELVNELIPYTPDPPVGMPKTFYQPGSHVHGSTGNWGPQNAQRTREVADLGITGNSPRYIPHLVNAINVFKQYGVGVVTSGVPSQHNPKGDGEFWDQLDAWSANDIWGLLNNNGGGIGYHPYGGLNAGTNLSTGVLGQVKSIRDFIDLYDPGVSDQLPLLFTEYGVSAEVPGGKNPQTLVYQGGGHDSRLQQMGNFLDQALTNWETHAEALKLVTICWFWLCDYTEGYGAGMGSFAYFGLRYDSAAQSKFGGASIWKAHVKDAWDQHDAAPVVVSPPPICTTMAPTAVTSTSAVFQASVNPKGTATTVVWDFGPTIAYGTTTTPADSAGAGNGTTIVQRVWGGFAPGSTLHVRARATSSAGTDVGGDQTFTFLPATTGGPDVVTGPATAITAHSATLTGDIDPKGLPATWHFEWGTDPTLAAHSTTPDRTLGAVGPPPTSYPLSVSLPGTGAGVVSSSPPGIDTSAGALSHDFADGTVVTLTEAPTAPDTFGGWSGDGSGAGTTRTVTMSAARNVVATFTAPVVTPGPWTLDVSFAGGGSGTVTSSPAGINSSSHATHDFADGTVVTLSQSHSGAYTFLGWTGNGVDSGATDRQVTMTGNRSVTANFGVVAASADWYVDGANPNPGTGTVSNPYKTIQQGINAAVGGDVVSVAENAYTPISFTKSGITLRGQGADETRPKISGAGTNADHGLALTGASTGMTIENFIIEDITQPPGGNQMSGLYLIGNPGPHDNNFNNIAVRRILGPDANAGTAGIGMYHYTSYPYSTTTAIRNNTFTGCEIYEIGAGSVDGYNECMGVFMSGCFNNLFDGCDFYLIRKEAIRDLDGLRNRATGNHAYLCWAGISPNYGSGMKVYNNASYYNQIAFEGKHCGYYLAGGAAGTQHWGPGETASATNNRTIYAHNTTFGNIASSMDLGQGGDLYNYVTVKDNCWGDRGTVLLRDFTPIGGSIEVDHNNYNTAPGTPPNAPRARYARDFPGTGSQDNSFPFSGYGGHTYETNGTATPVTFADPPSGDFTKSGPTLTGEDLGDGYGTQVGANGGTLGPAKRTVTFHTYSASTTMGNAGQLGSLSNGAYDDAWAATSNTGSITFDLGSDKSVGFIVLDTIIRQNGPGQYRGYTIETATAAAPGTFVQRRASAVPDNLRTSTKHRWNAVNARYVRFNINSMFQGGGDRAEICQVRLGHL